MNNEFDDITSRIAEAPSWHDENGVPRYGAFAPSAVPNIYANEAVLFKIACQGCGEKFQVSLSRAAIEFSIVDQEPGTLRDRINNKTLHYGDPPNTGCCSTGPTMNSEPRRVLEYWHKSRDTGYEWKRDETMEIDIEPDWVDGSKEVKA